MTDPTMQIPDFVQSETFKMQVEPSNKDTYVGTVSFQEMGLKKEIMQSITDCGFEHPSEVQSQVIPKALLRQDILCQAKSGMGKTAVFVLSILNQGLFLGDHVSAIVICHTRELARQVQNEFDRMKKRLVESIGKDIQTASYIGGNPESNDVDDLKNRKPTIIVGTPGRLASLNNSGALDLSKLDTFVIDECDKILSSKSELDIMSLFMSSSKNKQVMMFSATISEQNKALCRKYLKNPFEVFIDDGEKLFLHGLHLYSKKLQDMEKQDKLGEILDEIDFNQAIIFADRKERCQAIVQRLKKEKYPCGILYGRMEEYLREREFERFRKGESRILVSTDLCGRGIDIEKVNLVVNFDMALDSDQFLHRVGRAGRFGTKGVAISFIDTEEDEKVLKEVQSRFAVQMKELPDDLKEIPSTYYK
ncbi:DEAD/DEAH box helicase, putative [Entamoeba histolytica HM-1:IMSS-B]|uniref:RNA helicase n=8 Tax=Entamoeba TaxID=5758 RepID=C4M9V7_ENTH1|nr:DEAD/DEAH box helicase, putative [Entamoeba nuttalli P19]XP_649638.1 DEAD/DEAH box helicase, putative [Entamoeba histolytica HM-1:IMSS]EMD44359.1 ATPdependent RNA helicase SUB2, putative [Entamoeba histolytica KU27]EMH75241.1 DEAD/DEAH box helicase, putative [Entamoeba histolytica HM-1:IMSS-B]EMS16491.1 ATP-dependent RNA helicase SUB2, putative [Entamoeba histolytica HM-3:IMSS]ENY63954.1 ATP-dependent RNA helicase SUB2, putative [Entamoeba histolytica HM-1:IMSS-A]BAN38997.1 DEAD/DEAH box h|eukprot:XP_008857304.1 DEAD/DEAH box helicase, putative [Entamoeba nuttalli P19]